MSMFARKGTMVRKNRNRSSRRGQHGPNAPTVQENLGMAFGLDERTLQPSPCHSSTSSILNYDDEKQLVRRHSDGTDDPDQVLTAYGSIIMDIQEANEDALNYCDFLLRTTSIIGKRAVVIFILGASLVLPLSMMALGTTYQTDCPKEPKIPIFLLVAGAFYFIKITLELWQLIRARKFDYYDEFYRDGIDHPASRSSRLTHLVITIFLITWFVFGNIWFYAIWKPNYVQPLHDPSNWCSEVLYMYTFYQFIIMYVATVVYLIYILCTLIYFIKFKYFANPA